MTHRSTNGDSDNAPAVALDERGYLLSYHHTRHSVANLEKFSAPGTQTCWYEASGRFDYLCVSSACGFPIRQFLQSARVNPLSSQRIHRFAYRYADVGFCPTDEDHVKPYLALAIARIRMTPSLTQHYGNIAIRRSSQAICTHDHTHIAVTALGGLGISDIYALVYANSLADCAAFIESHIMKLTTATIGLTGGAAEAAPMPFAELSMTCCINTWARQNPTADKITQTQHSFRVGVRPGSISRSIAEISTVAEKLCTPVNFRSNSLSAIEVNPEHPMSISKMCVFRERLEILVDNPNSGITSCQTYHTFPVTQTPMAHLPDITLGGANKLEIDIADIEKAMKAVASDLPMFLQHTLRNCLSRLNELIRHPVFHGYAINHLGFAATFVAHLIDPQSPWHKLGKHDKISLASDLLFHIDSAIRNFGELDEIEYSVSDETLVSCDGIQKVLEGCCAIQNTAWFHGTRLIGQGDESSPAQFLNLASPDSRLQTKHYGNGFIICRVGVTTMIHYSNALKVIREVGRTLFGTMATSRTPNIDMTDLDQRIRSATTALLKKSMLNELGVKPDAEFIERQQPISRIVDEGIQYWLRQRNGRESTVTSKLWNNAQTQTRRLYEYICSEDRLVTLAGAARVSRMEALDRCRRAIRITVDHLTTLKYGAADVFADAFMIYSVESPRSKKGDEVRRFIFSKVYETHRYLYNHRQQGLDDRLARLLGHRSLATAFVVGRTEVRSGNIIGSLECPDLVLKTLEYFGVDIGNAAAYCNPWLDVLAKIRSLLRKMSSEPNLRRIGKLIDPAAERICEELESDQSVADVMRRHFVDNPLEAIFATDDMHFRNELSALLHFWERQRMSTPAPRHKAANGSFFINPRWSEDPWAQVDEGKIFEMLGGQID